MVLLYVTLVMNQMKTLEEVPPEFREAVKERLIQFGYKFPKEK